MIELSFAQSAQQLLAPLSDYLAPQGVGWKRRRSRKLLVPSGVWIRWLEDELTLSLGSMPPIEWLTWPRLGHTLVQEREAELLSRLSLTLLLLNGFAHPDKGALKGSALLQKYLKQSSQLPQLATATSAALFRHMEMFRGDGEDMGELEAWQADLGRAAFGPKGMLATQNHTRQPALVSLADTWSSKLPAPLHDPTTQAQHGGELALFGISQLSPLHFDWLQTLKAQGWKLHIFALNPSRQYWEDLQGDSHSEGEQTSPQMRLLDVPENSLLLEWGPGGLQTHANLLALAEHESRFHAAPSEAEASREQPLLGHIQQDILDRRGKLEVRKQPELTPPAQEPTPRCGLQLWPTPTVERAVEAAALQAWGRVSASESDAQPMAWEDIQVAYPRASAGEHLAAIESVFGAARGIPYRLVDAPLKHFSETLAAAVALGEFVNEPVTGGRLLTLLKQPLFAPHLSEWTAGELASWVEEHGVRLGGDGNDQAGTYLSQERFHWEQGLEATVNGWLRGEQEPGLRGKGGVAEELHLSEASPHATGQLVRVTSSLLADRKRLRAASLTPDAWRSVLQELLAVYLCPQSPQEQQDFLALSESLDAFAAQSLTLEPLPFRLLWPLVQDQLENLTEARGQTGVVVGSLEQLACLPARVRFVLGLDEGAYPKGSSTSLSQKQRYDFLLCLLGTSEELILSYRTRDLVRGSGKEPSPLISELLEHVGRDYHHLGADNFLPQELPFRRQLLPSTLGPRAAYPPLVRTTPASVHERARPNSSASQPAAPRNLSLRLLAASLLRPLETFLRIHWQAEFQFLEHPHLLEHEPFDLSKGKQRRLLLAAVERSLLLGGAPDQALAQVRAIEVAQGRMPEGLFDSALWDQLRHQLQPWQEPIEELQAGVSVHRFGPTRAPAVGTWYTHEPLRLAAPAGDVLLTGPVPLFAKERQFVLFEPRKPDPKKPEEILPQSPVLEGLLGLCALTANGTISPGEAALDIHFPERKPTHWNLQLPSQAGCIELLQNAAQALNSETLPPSWGLVDGLHARLGMPPAGAGYTGGKSNFAHSQVVVEPLSHLELAPPSEEEISEFDTRAVAPLLALCPSLLPSGAK